MPHSYRKGTLEKPRTVFIGHEDFAEGLETIVGDLFIYSNFMQAHLDIEPHEVDLLILHKSKKGSDNAAGQLIRWMSNIFIICIYARGSILPRLPNDGGQIIAKTVFEREFHVTLASGELGDLIRRATREIKSAKGLPCFLRRRTNHYGPSWNDPIRSFGWLVNSDQSGNIAFVDSGESPSDPLSVVVIPEEIASQAPLTEWVLACVRTWKMWRPSIFQSVPEWKEEHLWRTAQENQLHRSLDELNTRKEEFLAQIESEKERLLQQLSEEDLRASNKDRRLLTTKGESLVEAVSEALRRLGFGVEIPPEETTGMKKEDLLLTFPEWSDWTASAEVKGFSRTGVKVSDVIKLNKRRIRRGSTKAIMFINMEFSKSPSVRNPPLNNDESRECAIELDVLVVDTRELFIALQDEGEADQLRSAIKDDVGVFKRPLRS